MWVKGLYFMLCKGDFRFLVCLGLYQVAKKTLFTIKIYNIFEEMP